jgi:esterase
MKLFYREIGEGKPIVLIHGLFGASDNLLSVGKILAEKYKVYLIDARNHGQSPHSEDWNYSLMAEDLREFLMDHNIVNPVIIGHSMGGKTVMKFASLYEDMAEKFVVMDISPRYYSRHHDDILDGLNSIKPENIQSRQEADLKLAEKIQEPFVRQFLLKNLERTNEGFRWKLNLPVITGKIDIIGEPLNDNVRISKPTLFIRGENSGYVREQDEELIHKLFTNSQIVTIEGCGHWLHAEKPKEFSEALLTFIETS